MARDVLYVAKFGCCKLIVAKSGCKYGLEDALRKLESIFNFTQAHNRICEWTNERTNETSLLCVAASAITNHFTKKYRKNPKENSCYRLHKVISYILKTLNQQEKWTETHFLMAISQTPHRGLSNHTPRDRVCDCINCDKCIGNILNFY